MGVHPSYNAMGQRGAITPQCHGLWGACIGRGASSGEGDASRGVYPGGGTSGGASRGTSEGAFRGGGQQVGGSNPTGMHSYSNCASQLILYLQIPRRYL